MFIVLIAISIHPMETEILLVPPGLRLIEDPSITLPADYHYANRLTPLPDYRDGTGNPKSGWAARFITTRRFASDQSAWIFFRMSDLQRSVSLPNKGTQAAFRFWPVATTMIIEIYQGDALQKGHENLTEIAAMSKIEADSNSLAKTCYPVSWTYARFKPDRTPAIDSAKVRECHQCHSIAFHLTGDLLFTRFP